MSALRSLGSSLAGLGRGSARCFSNLSAAHSMNFDSDLFDLQVVSMADKQEKVLPGGRHLFPLLPSRCYACNAFTTSCTCCYCCRSQLLRPVASAASLRCDRQCGRTAHPAFPVVVAGATAGPD